jgi:hypothetical protein
MYRRRALQSLVQMATLAGTVGHASADQQCQNSPMGLACTSFIPLDRLQQVYAPQSQSQWCWAACISMIFAFNDHPIGQARIVEDAYGSIINMPGNYPALFGSLNRVWTDDDGEEFEVSVNHLFSPEFGVGTLTNADLARELENENPILYCTIQHAMILTSMSYVGGTVFEGWVMDPWPGNGLRRLNRAEMTPFYFGGQLRMAASIEIL